MRSAAVIVVALVLATSPQGSWAQGSWGTSSEGYAGQSTGMAVTESAEEVRIALAADVLFDFDKSDITPKAGETLVKVADIVRKTGPRKAVRIEGHTDAKGAADYNQALSQRRADSVKSWLADHGKLKGVKLSTEGFGAQRPVAPNTKPDGTDDPEGRKKNRRVEIVIPRR